MQAEPSLDRLQRWMLEVIVHPGSTAEAIESGPAQEEIEAEAVESLIIPSRSLTSVERVGVYHGMYLLRMHEALESDYPGVAHLLGHDRFHDLVRDYVQVFPSRSYTLNRLGDHLPEFIRDHAAVRRRKLLVDMARYERLVNQVFDEEESTALSAEQIAAIPADAWDRARLKPIPAFRLIELRYPVAEYIASVRMETAHPAMRVRPNWIALHRRDYAVRRLELTKREFSLLTALAAGLTLGDAIREVGRRFRRRVSEPELFDWFRKWSYAGIFSSVET